MGSVACSLSLLFASGANKAGGDGLLHEPPVDFLASAFGSADQGALGELIDETRRAMGCIENPATSVVGEELRVSPGTLDMETQAVESRGRRLLEESRRWRHPSTGSRTFPMPRYGSVSRSTSRSDRLILTQARSRASQLSLRVTGRRCGNLEHQLY